MITQKKNRKEHRVYSIRCAGAALLVFAYASPSQEQVLPGNPIQSEHARND